MENISDLIKHQKVSTEELRRFLEKIIQLEEGSISEFSINDKIIGHDIENILPDLFKIEKVYGEPDFVQGDYGNMVLEGAPVIGYTIQIRNKDAVRKLYEESYELLYPDSISKFLFKNNGGIVWNCHSERCKEHENKIADLIQPEKISFYLSKIVQDGFYRCHEHGCKNGFSISESGEIDFWVKN